MFKKFRETIRRYYPYVILLLVCLVLYFNQQTVKQVQSEVDYALRDITCDSIEVNQVQEAQRSAERAMIIAVDRHNTAQSLIKYCIKINENQMILQDLLSDYGIQIRAQISYITKLETTLSENGLPCPADTQP